MNKQKSNTIGFKQYTGKAGLAALVVAASMTVGSSQALAEVVCFNTPIAVPVTTSGTYINLFTGASNTVPGNVTGWDFNPWGSGNLFLYVAATTPTSGLVATAGVFDNLAPGTPVDGSSTYGVNGSSPATYRAGVTNGKLGVRFVESGNTYYAWVDMTTTGPSTGLPATINKWCFENTPDTGISVGTTPVTLQTFSID